MDTFSLVTKLRTLRLLLSVSAIKKWFVTQLDINNNFLNGDLDEEIYTVFPQRYIEIIGRQVALNLVCKLHKSLYSLKQASREGNHKLTSVIIDQGFT